MYGVLGPKYNIDATQSLIQRTLQKRRWKEARPRSWDNAAKEHLMDVARPLYP